LAAQGLQGFFAAQGLHGLHGFLAAQGLQAVFFAAHGLHGLQAFLAAQGLVWAVAGPALSIVAAVKAGTARARPNSTGIVAVDERRDLVVLRMV
jgi:hypothetical protein